MAQNLTISRSDIDRIIAEAAVRDVPASAAALDLAIPDFCGTYRRQVRPIVMIVIGFLKFVNKQWADALAALVAIVDQLCPGQ
jgi:hypothetical protein